MLRLESMVRDVRYACRSLARRPGFAAVAVMTLAVGIGTMTVAFSAVNAFFLAGPPIDVDGAGTIAVTDNTPETEGASFREFEALVRDVPALDITAQTIVTLSRRRGETAAIAWGLAVSDNYFDTLGVRAASGRTFGAVNELSAVVSDRFWRQELSQASLTGLTVSLNGLDVPFVGVLPSDFRAGFYDADVWVRIADWDALRLPARLRRPDMFLFRLIGRLRPDATASAANSQVRAVAGELAKAWPATNARRTASFVPFDKGRGTERRAIAVMATMAMTMIGIVLLIALFNVVGLLLARAVDREREMTLRGALGASRARLTQQLVIESLVIASLGAALALFVSRWSNDLLATFAPEAPIPQRIDVTPDWTVALFAGVLMIVCGVGAGLLPARRATRLAIATAIAPPTIIGGGRSGRLRAGIVSIQVAGATLLLTLAGLLVRSAITTAAAPLGFEIERAIVVELDPASHGYTEPAAQRLVSDLLSNLRDTPGVTSATVMDRVPFYVGFPMHVEVALDGRSCALETCPVAGRYRVGPAYFRTMGIPLLRGREFDGSSVDAQSVVISDTMARSVWPSTDPVGQWVTLGTEARRKQVVGVAADTVHRVVNERLEPYVYLPFEGTDYGNAVAVVLRTAGAPEPLMRTVSNQIRALDPALPVVQLRTMEERIAAREQSGNLIVVRFFGICGVLALFLSVVGLVGTVAYSVGQRVREFGVRAAIGASPGDQARLVLGSALKMAVPGIAIGLFGTLLLSWLIASQVRGIDFNSPLTYALVAVLQLAIATAAAAVPGRRASHANPLAALRTD
jgi:predicted permease